MTDISRLKKLDPQLYEDLLDYERKIYSTMAKRTDGITKVRNLVLKGSNKEAWALFREIKKA